MNLDRRKVFFAIAGLAIAIAAGWIRTRSSGNDGYIANLIVTLFAVLAGFLSVVLNMVLIASPLAFKSKQAQAVYARQIKRRILRHSGIFYCYLVILLLVFLSELCRPYWPGTARLLEIFYCGLAACGLLWSFAVPGTLAKLHEEQMILAQENRKP